MNLKAFFVAALQSALDLGVATPDDVLKHVTPDVLAQHLPRPLWARLFTACLGAPRVDAQLVIETIGVPNLCEHVPAPLIWACLAEIGNRSLGRETEDAPILLRPKSATTPPPPPQTPGRNKPLTAPPPDVIARPGTLTPAPKVGPAIPPPSVTPVGTGTQSLQDIVAELEAEASRDDRPSTSPPSRVRQPTQQRFRQSNTGTGGIGRLASRRPQAAMAPTARRGQTESEDAEADSGKGEDWRNTLAVEDEQLVDWQSSEETLTVADDEPKR